MATKKTETEKKTTAKKTKKAEAPKMVRFKGWEAVCVNNVWRHKCPHCGASLMALQIKRFSNKCIVCGYPAEEE